MASYAAVVSLIRVIRDLEHHPSVPISLDKQLLDSITQRITYFEEFLHSYVSPPVAGDEEREEADPLEMRIANAAHTAEDAIESHILECIQLEEEKIKSNNKCFSILQSVVKKMDSIKKVTLEAVDTQKKKKSPEVVFHDQVVMPKVTPSETMVGSDGVVLEIMEKLAGGQLDCQVIPIVGMGGIGKTFLAKTIYAKPFIKERFDVCAWATISQHYDTEQILCELLSQATSTKKEQHSGESVDELGLDLHKYLFSRRFLIVMDDMWSIDSWDEIQRFFPNNGNGSRVLVTTRLSLLSSQLNSSDYSLRMSFLDKASSWELFSKTVFGEKSSCPSELEEIGEKIVDNCRGLPLSIAVVGGLLKKMDGTRASWESIRDNFTSVVNMNDDKHCLKLLKLSYNHLPVHLKPCFLYMGAFEEDEKISVTTLVQLWVSEGFLKPTNGEALETTARGFLQDLIDRNLIIIGELGTTGSLRFCRIHDLVRDMCLNECHKEDFFHVVGKYNSPISQRRRVVIPKHTSEEDINYKLMYMSHTRSIICEHENVSSFQNLVLLRTLQAYTKTTFCYNEIHLDSVLFRCVNLRHLAIHSPEISSGFLSLSHLWNLQTLIVRYELFQSVLVPDFWKMPRIRHFEFYYSYACLQDPPNIDDGDVVVMEHLHTLKGVKNFKCSEGVLERIPNVKRLKLEYNHCYDGYDGYFLENLKYLCALESLSICLRDESSAMNPPREITFLPSLKKLSLFMGTEYEWDHMLEKIGSLPLLEKLKLFCGCFRNEEWQIAQGQFPCLKYLKLEFCEGLERLAAVEEDSSILPRLEHLHLISLIELEKIPSELGNIDTLKSIKVSVCADELVSSVKEMFDEQVDLQGGEDQLSFHVEVNVKKEQQHLMSLACPKFYVHLDL